ncbi:MAG: NADP-dependent malic enzyme [Calditrichaeota bacterium]|nr:NADP-dependent malic enzyme [Calditrichota bacterium]
MNLKEESLLYHSRPRVGKIEVTPTKPCLTQRDLSLAYTPGVAEPCLEIEKNPETAYNYTSKGNLVAVITNGSAVLGLGNIGALAGKPVMEGKGVLFKRFADVDVFDIELNTQDPDEIINTVKLLEPTFGGINLEDISAPNCFYIEETLKKALSIPVFHDDQHGTAIISGAALLNACEIIGKQLKDIKVVFNGAGAAGIACAKFYITLGVNTENILMCDSKGVIYEGREDTDPEHPRYNKYKAEFVRKTDARTLAEALEGADAFCGVSVADCVTKDMVRSMADNPIVFAMANPDPEISYEDAIAARSDCIMATGRSDYPNQVNNVLGFPFIFRGALDVRATTINEEMKIAAARALANLAKEDVPEAVYHAYTIDKIEFGRDYLIPKPFDPRVLMWEASAVAKAACETGVALQPIKDFDAYWEELESRLGRSKEMIRNVINKAKRKPTRIAFPEGLDETIIRASARILEEGIGTPVLMGKKETVMNKAEELSVNLNDVEIINPESHPRFIEFSEKIFSQQARKGITLKEARRLMRRRIFFAPMLLAEDEVDAVVCGQMHHIPDVIKPALKLIPLKKGISGVSGIHMLMFKHDIIFCADTIINIFPDSEKLAEIAICAADTAIRFDIEPRIAMLSFSNFGSVQHQASSIIANAVKLVHERRPDLEIDGEMRPGVALNESVLAKRYPFSTLTKKANVLVFPGLASGNIATNLLTELGSAETIGPMLMGFTKPFHVVHRGASVDEIVSITAIASVEAQHIASGDSY